MVAKWVLRCFAWAVIFVSGMLLAANQTDSVSIANHDLKELGDFLSVVMALVGCFLCWMSELMFAETTPTTNPNPS